MCSAKANVRYGPIADIVSRVVLADSPEKAGSARSTIASDAVRLMRK
jgi:hypothetical protein